MGMVLKSVLFLLRRGPVIIETGKLIGRSLIAVPALTEGGATHDAGGAGRIEAVEHELRLAQEERRQLLQEVAQLSKEVASLRSEAERTGGRMMILMLLFAAFVGAGLVLGAVILSRFP